MQRASARESTKMRYARKNMKKHVWMFMLLGVCFICDMCKNELLARKIRDPPNWSSLHLEMAMMIMMKIIQLRWWWFFKRIKKAHYFTHICMHQCFYISEIIRVSFTLTLICMLRFLKNKTTMQMNALH